MTVRDNKIKIFLNLYKEKIKYFQNIIKYVNCGGNLSVLKCFKLFCSKRKCRATKKILISQTLRMLYLKISETIKIIESVLNRIKNKEIKRVTGIVNGTINDIFKNF